MSGNQVIQLSGSQIKSEWTYWQHQFLTVHYQVPDVIILIENLDTCG